MTRILVTLGIILIVVGLVWPWLGKLGFGRLPGDIVIERENFRFYFPVTSMIIVSLVLSLIFWLFRK
jgi:ribose/xylose/arabinose/galactoside ABC-type transport system permease subunit